MSKFREALQDWVTSDIAEAELAEAIGVKDTQTGQVEQMMGYILELLCAEGMLESNWDSYRWHPEFDRKE